MAAAAVDMFRGKNIQSVESLLSAQKGQRVEKMIQEIQMTTKNTFHFMAIAPDKPDTLLVLITSKKTTIDKGWTAMRKTLPLLTKLAP